jgi:hypothetical protein
MNYKFYLIENYLNNKLHHNRENVQLYLHIVDVHDEIAHAHKPPMLAEKY